MLIGRMYSNDGKISCLLSHILVWSVLFQIQDAQAAMRLYTLEKKKWEAAIRNKANNKKLKT